MSYTPTEWSNGDVITAEKLNKLEGAVEELSESSDSILIVTVIQEGTSESLNYTWQEIDSAVRQQGIIPVLYQTQSSQGNEYNM